MNTPTYILAIDIGNTQCKIALMLKHEVVQKFICTHAQLAHTINELHGNNNISQLVICNVVASMQETVLHLVSKYKTLLLSHESKLPYNTLYKSMATLGLDRIALVAAASAQFPKQNTLVIALGTCITYNFLNAHNEFEGGAIAPGMYMRLKAMHHFTKGLPLVTPNANIPLVGNDTKSCLQSGVQHGITAELTDIIAQYAAKYKNLNVVLTGGDMLTFATQIKCKIFANENFQFHGLYEMLQHNTN